jgi:hypothetical protein
MIRDCIITEQDITTQRLAASLNKFEMFKNNYIFLVLIIVIVLHFNGCSKGEVDTNLAYEVKTYLPINTVTIEHVTTIVENEPVQFRLEYPGCYEVGINQYKGVGDVVTTRTYLPTISCNDTNTGIRYIGVYFIKNSRNAEFEMNKRINEYQTYASSSRYNDFELIEKNRVLVDSIKGWEIAVSFTIKSNPFNKLSMFNTPREPTSIVIREIFLDYKDMVGSIILLSNEDQDTQDNIDYNYVVRMFKILE